MTIGQLVEISGILGCEMGTFGDCTAFLNKGSNTKLFEITTNFGYNHTGNQILYSGEFFVQMINFFLTINQHIICD